MTCRNCHDRPIGCLACSHPPVDKIGLAWCGAAAGVALTFAVWSIGWMLFA